MKLTIDFDPEIRIKRSSAQINILYKAEDLFGRQIAAGINFPLRQIGPLTSEVLVLGFPDEMGEVCLICPDKRVPGGGRLS